MTKSYRVRFGVKLGGLFPNAATFVFYAHRDSAKELQDQVRVIRQTLTVVGQGSLAARLICDVEAPRNA